jgi:hypothetical protein
MHLMAKVPPPCQPRVNRYGPISKLQLSIVIKTGENHSLSVECAKAKLFVHTVFPELYGWDKRITTVGDDVEGICEQFER